VITPRLIFAAHLAIIAALIVLNAGILVMDALGHGYLFGFSRLLALQGETNIPAMFSAAALGACSIVAFANRRRLGKVHPDRSAWSILAWVFAFMALDEAVMIHEMADDIGRRVGAGGVFQHVGVFVYVPVVLWLSCRLFPFWLRQEKQLQVWFVVAGAVYVLAAAGLELPENWLESRGVSYDDIRLKLLFITEESGEMLAVAMFLRSFLTIFELAGGGLLIPLEVRPQSTSIESSPIRARAGAREAIVSPSRVKRATSGRRRANS
jgi:hypothetical protein